MLQANISKPIAISFGAHVALGIVLSLSFSAPDLVQQTPNAQPMIEAVVIDTAALEAKKQEKQRREEAQRQAEAKKREDERRKKQEAERKRQAEVERKRKAEEKRKADAAAAEAKRKKEEEDKRKKAEDEKRQREEAERKRKDEEARIAREKAEADRKRKEQEARELAEQQRMLQEQLEAEQAATQAQRSRQVLTEVQKYQALIKSTVQRYLIVDDAYYGKMCRLNIKLAPSGLVIKVEILEGDPVLCEASERAVYAPNELPVSEDPEVYQKLKDINLTVEPKR